MDLHFRCSILEEARTVGGRDGVVLLVMARVNIESDQEVKNGQARDWAMSVSGTEGETSQEVSEMNMVSKIVKSGLILGPQDTAGKVCQSRRCHNIFTVVSSFLFLEFAR